MSKSQQNLNQKAQKDNQGNNQANKQENNQANKQESNQANKQEKEANKKKATQTKKDKKNNKNNDKKNDKGSRFPKPPANLRIIKLSFTNLIFIAAILLGAILFFNTYFQPELGEEIGIDDFLNNIKSDRYSQVDIRNDGNAVGVGKRVNLLQGEVEIEDLQKSMEAENLNTTIVTSDGLEKKSLSELVNELKAPESLAEGFKDAIDELRGDVIEEIYILDSRIIADWGQEEKKDWLIEEKGENDLISLLDANNTDIASLPVRVSYLRSSGVAVNNDEFINSFNNGKYASIWQVGESVYAKVSSVHVHRNFVNFGTATADFTKMLQEEGINLSSQDVEFNVLPISQIDYNVIINLVLVGGLLFTGFMLLKSLNGAGGGLMKFGQSKARMFFGQKANVDFSDVAGVDEAKQELKEVVDFLKNPKKYIKLGAKIPRGVLMVGEPGTGKTLMARAVAGEAGVPFFHTSGSEFEEMLVGAGASRVRDLFEKAKKASPALIFIDEIDAVGRKRGTTIQSSSTEQTLNQILVEMDGFEQRDNVIVIAATNRPDVLDPALLRPGRFDRKVVLQLPDIEGRKAIIKIHAEDKPISKDVDFEKVAKRTVGFTGADLENMLNEAAIIVAKESRKEITPDDIEEAATKVQAGPIRKRKRTDRELKMTAYHEAAHAIVMKKTPESDTVHRITILSRGMALGYTMPLPETDELQVTRTKMVSKIMALLAGYVSEEIKFDDVSTGSANDIEKATNIAKRMVKKFGMSKKLGLVQYGDPDEEPQMGWGYGKSGYSEATAEMIDEEIRGIITKAKENVEKILKENSDIHEKLANMLLEKEVVEAEEFEELFE
jgi:cell division protease FtsH